MTIKLLDQCRKNSDISEWLLSLLSGKLHKRINLKQSFKNYFFLASWI